MTDDSPYRYTPEREGPSDRPVEVWLGSYRRPTFGVVLSPDEIRRLGFETKYLFLAFVLGTLAFGFVLVAALPSVLPRLDPARNGGSGEWFALALLGSAALLALTLQVLTAWLAYRVAQVAVRYGAAAIGLAILALVPPLHVLVVLGLSQHARWHLRRHGIRSGLWGPDTEMLPDRGAW